MADSLVMRRNSRGQRRAILYSRVSSEEQARGYSLSDQVALLEQYASLRQIEMVAKFQDDASARSREAIGESFESRPGFMRLMAWVRAGRGRANLLLFKDWSRFGRDATDSLVMIKRLEQLGIECQAVEQPIDWEVPEQWPLVMLYLGMPEAENRRRSLNVVRGMRRANREGRWTTTPPYGYRRSYDEEGRMILVPDDGERGLADLMVRAFELAAEAQLSLNEIRLHLGREARRRGRRWYGSRYRFGQALRNIVYVGQIRLRPWRDEPEEVVEGCHEALLSKDLFDRVQWGLDGRQGPKAIYREELPLRKHLICPDCRARWTGSGSRSKTGRIYWYYP